MYLSMRGVCSWLVYESVHKGFVCVLKHSGILLCHFWNVLVEELGGVAYMCIFNVCGMVLYIFGKFGCFVPVCVCL